MGDVHPDGNPHYMWDPRRAAKVATGIATRLAALDPANAATYRANGEKFVGVLEKWRKHWETELAPLRGKKVVAYHRSFSYLAELLRRTFAVDVETCPAAVDACACSPSSPTWLRLHASFITAGEPTEPPAGAPPRDPPYFKPLVVRRQDPTDSSTQGDLFEEH